ncbi:MAG TPA: LytR C-terminal domain-containing protein [Candidatus Woesebacteria bacterium]|nr:LytR C-terminal domain-containing protein [Candidatus Woesebacteria bacterium]
MLYIYLDSHQIKLLHLKKSLLGQYDVSFYGKTFDVDLIQNGIPGNIDVINSAVKKTLEEIPEQPLKEKDITLILPVEAFSFFRTELPLDVTPGVLESFLKEKAKAQNIEVDSMDFSYLIQESEGQKQVLFFGIKKETLTAFEQPFKLLDLKVTSIIPESLTYYKLFEKTLRKNKKENIWYVSYENNLLQGYVYDSFGLLEGEKWEAPIAADGKVEEVLQKKGAEYVAKNLKLNRLILSGKQADGIRQDTFTKNVGVWTNPLIRIIPHFYGDYLKMLQHDTKPLPILEYDMLIGAFIFSQENKAFSLLGKTNSAIPTMQVPSVNLSDKKFPVKNAVLFVISFIITFGILYGLSRVNWNNIQGFNMPSLAGISIPGMNQPTPTPVLEPTIPPPTPTPTPSILREDINVKVLNGSGIAGKASDVKAFFQEKGYGEILTGNADAFDYETTVIQIKEDGDPAIRKYVEEDIASEVSSPEFEILDEGEAADVMVIVGTDFR